MVEVGWDPSGEVASPSDEGHQLWIIQQGMVV